MSPDILNSTTLNELFRTAITLSDSETVTNSGSDHQVFIYKVSNNTDADIATSVVFSEVFSGSVEIYNDTDFLNCSFSIDSTTSIDAVDMYEVSETYYDNVYGTDLLSSPVEVDYLNNTTVTADENSVTCNVYIKARKTSYILINVDPATFVLNYNINVPTPLLDAPAEPVNSSPVFGEIVKVRGSGNFDLSVSPEAVSGLIGSDVNIGVSVYTDKVVQATIKYGQYTTTSNYYYNPETVADPVSLREELVQATQDVGVVMLPLPGAASSTGLYDVINANLAIKEGASIEVILNAPIQDTAIVSALKPGVPTAAAVDSDDKYSMTFWLTNLRRRRYLKRRNGMRL